MLGRNTIGDLAMLRMRVEISTGMVIGRTSRTLRLVRSNRHKGSPILSR